MPSSRIVGLGADLTCFGGVIPTADNMGCLVEHARAIERTFALPLEWISGGNASALQLIASGRMPKRINRVRIGEAILLGRETVHRSAWPGTFQDAFLLRAEVIGLKAKPSVPLGERAEDAFGRVASFADHGEVEPAILNVGREDVDVEGMTPGDAQLTILGTSSACLIVDVSRAERKICVGDELTFSLNYAALLATMTSPYIGKRPRRGGSSLADDRPPDNRGRPNGMEQA